MISSERSQNIIVAFLIISAMVSSVFLVGNVQYYSGSYVLAGRMNVNLVEVLAGNVDQENESIYPFLSFTFNFQTDSPIEGNVRLTVIYGTVWLNDDLLSYTVFNRYLNNDADQLLHPGYDSNFTLASEINSETDRNTVLQADMVDTWNWYIRLRYTFITFDEAQSQTSRTLYFNATGVTIVT
ncbi:MAG: hypothetical protein AM326_05525 [Candidatus Thorarchaeota archaeon SMTZ-45]|nr:MAG: hypothetical protein AM325_03680 [Candidatus Thorarchaeota archaeon SMTZ1-45]KXH77172.1 MAG: hypothetical protein AM326_05525 [Candidatus Thorarchaeota archaeon SMTZ-45]